MKKCLKSTTGKHEFVEEEIGQYDFEELEKRDILPKNKIARWFAKTFDAYSTYEKIKITRRYAPVCRFCETADNRKPIQVKVIIKENEYSHAYMG